MQTPSPSSAPTPEPPTPETQPAEPRAHAAPSNVLEAPEEVLTTLQKDGRRRWMYPVLSLGSWLTRRRVVGYLLIAIFMLLPIIPVGGYPAILLDVLHRRFHFFGLTLFANDTVLLMLFGIGVLVSVVLVTALLGRAWCGWACPQTVYMELVFRPIEALVEGPASRRQRQDGQELEIDGLMKKGLKYGLFLLVALVLAHTFVAYFVSWGDLLTFMTSSPSEHWGYFVMMAGVTALIMFDFAYFREQMCTLACPYARIQSVLLDRDSLIVSYDPARGEPRGRRSAKARKEEEGGAKIALGDCVDCGACVRTCPTGIDIRDGLQMECINCMQCIDACDAIMLKVNKPVGLIRYSSLNAIEQQPRRVFRPRLAIYVVVLSVVLSVFGWLIIGRSAVDAGVVRPNNGAPFMELPEGQVANRLRFRVQNRSGEEATFRIEALEPAGTEIKYIGSGDLSLEPSEMVHVDAWVVAPAAAFHSGSTPARFRVTDGGEANVELSFKLLGPSR